MISPPTRIAKAVVGPDVHGWIERWYSSELVQPLPQWPRIWVEPGSVLEVDCIENTVMLAASIKCDSGDYYLIPFNIVQKVG